MLMLNNTWLFLSTRRDLYRAKLVFALFLLSLSIFFAAGMLSYCVIRANAFRHPDRIPYIELRLPTVFWISTLILVGVSVSLHQAVRAVHRNRTRAFHNALSVATIAALAFTIVQAFGLRQLLEVHFSTTSGATKSYGMCFTMAFLHALHVVGGLAFLGFVIGQAARQRYDHERHWTVDNCANYWHFLDVVWVVMLLTFFIAR
jgi:heme/copper-type cytochrome/quinol oxidase subunit 3